MTTRIILEALVRIEISRLGTRLHEARHEFVFGELTGLFGNETGILGGASCTRAREANH